MNFLLFVLCYPILLSVSLVPFRVLYFISDVVLYPILYQIIGYRKHIVRQHLAIAFPEKTEQERIRIEKAFYHHLCDLFLEAVKPMSMSVKSMKRRFLMKNPETLQHYKDRNILLCCGHYANWEWSMILGKYTFHKGYAIYSRLQNKYFDRLIHRIRTRFDGILIDKGESLRVIRKVEQSGVVSLFGFATDQTPSVKMAKYWRPFLGTNVPVFTVFETIAKKYNHVVLFMDIQKQKRGYYTCELRLITNTPGIYKDFEITDIFTDMLENQICEKPEYYLWTHRRWKHSTAKT